MSIKNQLTCPKCQSIDFKVKKEATYVYTYELDSPLTSDSALTFESLPFLFDKRDMLASKEYIQCKNCNQQYSYDFSSNIIKSYK